MKFDKALSQVIPELMDRYKEVMYKGYEVVKMTRNTTTSTYGYEKPTVDINDIEVKHIKNRFEEIDGEITAIKVVFDIKYPRKRKYSPHEEYFKIIN